MFKYSIVFLFFFVAANAFAQHPYYYTIDDEDGLPSNEVYQVLQDKNGYMWIACDAGLFRYDGFEFKPYFNSRQNSKSISNLTLDQNNQVWCQNFTGQLFRTSGDSLELFFDATALVKQYPAYLLDEKSQVWIATDSLLLVKNTKGTIIKSIVLKALSENFVSVSDLESDGLGNVYASTFLGQVFVVSTNDFSVKTLALPSLLRSRNAMFKKDNILYLLNETSPKRTYVISQLNANGATIMKTLLPESTDALNYFIHPVQNKLYYGTSKGCLVLNNRFEPVTQKLFPNRKISFVYRDREGNTWFTSLQDGIFVVPDLNVSTYNSSNTLLKDNNVSTVERIGKDELLVGTYSGLLYSLDLRSNQLTELTALNTAANRSVRKIVKHNADICVARGSFYVINGRQVVLPELSNTRDFTFLGDTLFFVSSDRAGYALNYNGKHEVVKLRQKGGKKICVDSSLHTVYLACNDGLFAYTNGKMMELLDGDQSVFASSLLVQDGKLWIGTMTKGILVYANGKVIERITTASGLADNKVKTFVKDGNVLWVSTEKGLNVLDRSLKTARLATVLDGFPSVEINAIVRYKDEVFASTIKGLIRFSAKQEFTNAFVPQVDLNSVSINNKKMALDKSIALNYSDRDITISFSSVCLRSRGNFHYEYRLKNLNDEWVITGSKTPKAEFLSLPSGNYVFEVVAVNEDGVRSTPAQIALSVSVPYWEKWWFYALIALFAAGLVAFVFMLRLRYVKRAAIAKNNLILSRLTALKAQMNPHFMFNTLNSIQDLILLNDIKSANYYLIKFGNLMRKILKMSDANTVSVEEEIDFLNDYLELEKLRFGNDFHYTIQSDVNPNLLLPAMIIQPYVENAIKHGLLHKKGDKQLNVVFAEDGMHLVVSVTDNGIGRKKSDEIKQRQQGKHASFATAANEKRLDLMQEYHQKSHSVHIIDMEKEGLATGTHVELRFAR